MVREFCEWARTSPRPDPCSSFWKTCTGRIIRPWIYFRRWHDGAAARDSCRRYLSAGGGRGKTHPIHALSRRLLLQKLCLEVSLAPLSEVDVTEFVAGSGDRPELRQVAQVIAGQSGGNPLFMVAILDDLVERGLITRAPSGWQLQVALERIGVEVPRTLNELIETRIQRLALVERRLLETASVAGTEFGAATTAPAAELDAQRFEDSCEDLSRHGSFIHRAEMKLLPDNKPMQLYGFNHGMYRQVLYGRQGAERRARLHRAIGERLEEIFPPDQRGGVAVELAQHFGAAHEWLRALGYLRSALQVAKRRSAHQEALAILDRMIAIAANMPADARVVVELECLEQRAPIYVVMHDARVHETFKRLIETAARQGRADIQIRALLNFAYALSWSDLDSCVQALDEALRLSAGQSDAGAQALIQLRVSVRRMWVAGWNTVDAHRCEQALQVLRVSPDKPATAAAMLEYSMICLTSARYREAIDTFLRNHEFLLRSPDELSEFNVSRASWMNLVGTSWVPLFVGELGNSLTAFDAGILACRKEGNLAGAQSLGLWRCMLLFQLTDYEGMLEVCRPIASADPTPIVILPFERRLSLVMCGLAEAGSATLRCRARLSVGGGAPDPGTAGDVGLVYDADVGMGSGQPAAPDGRARGGGGTRGSIHTTGRRDGRANLAGVGVRDLGACGPGARRSDRGAGSHNEGAHCNEGLRDATRGLAGACDGGGSLQGDRQSPTRVPSCAHCRHDETAAGRVAAAKTSFAHAV